MFTVSLGANWSAPEPIFGTSLFPFVTLGGDFRSTQTTATGADTFLSGRLGLGVQGELAGGNLNVTVDAGRVLSDTTDLGVKFTWNTSF